MHLNFDDYTQMISLVGKTSKDKLITAMPVPHGLRISCDGNITWEQLDELRLAMTLMEKEHRPKTIRDY